MREVISQLEYLLDPRHYPSYWQTPSLSAFGGSPFAWEIAVLSVCAICGVILVPFYRMRWFTAAHAALVCVAPMFVGLFGTFYLAQMWSSWTGLSPVSEQMEIGITLPAHIGIASTVAVSITAGALYLRARRTQTI